MRRVSGRNAKYRAPAIAAKTNIPANKTSSELRVRCRRRNCALLDCSIGPGAGIGSENRVFKVSASNAIARACVADHEVRDFCHRHPAFYAVSPAGGTVIANVAVRAKAGAKINRFSEEPRPKADGAGGTGRQMPA